MKSTVKIGRSRDKDQKLAIVNPDSIAFNPDLWEVLGELDVPWVVKVAEIPPSSKENPVHAALIYQSKLHTFPKGYTLADIYRYMQTNLKFEPLSEEDYSQHPYGTMDLLQGMKAVDAEIEKLPQSEHATKLEALSKDLVIAMSALQSQGFYQWPKRDNEPPSYGLLKVYCVITERDGETVKEPGKSSTKIIREERRFAAPNIETVWEDLQIMRVMDEERTLIGVYEEHPQITVLKE